MLLDWRRNEGVINCGKQKLFLLLPAIATTANPFSAALLLRITASTAAAAAAAYFLFLLIFHHNLNYSAVQLALIRNQSAANNTRSMLRMHASEFESQIYTQQVRLTKFSSQSQ